ncbi:putative glycoside hydrolase family 15 protein [Actinokineospora sp. 24-640]
MRFRVVGRLTLVAILLLQVSCAHSTATTPPKPLPPCAWWYAIGDSPTDTELEKAANRYRVVVLNAQEIPAMKRLHQLNPEITVLVYKDLASTRNYPGAVVGDQDGQWLPSGIGYNAAQRQNPRWFAVDTAGARIEWRGYPKHWQMAVWDPAYQQAWTDAVTKEVVEQGWDGVLADNDFNTLRFYSQAVIEGTENAAETDRLLREGLDSLLTEAGEALRKKDKLLIPNLSESRLVPGRWTAHERFGGAMEEIFGFRDEGDGELLTFRGNAWKELRAQAALGESWLLLLTRVTEPKQERAGYASAALLAGPMSCWTPATTDTYLHPEWSPLQDTDLGEATDVALQRPDGVWTRPFTKGWVAVNPTGVPVTVIPPAGLTTLDGTPVTEVTLENADGAVLIKPES